MRIKSDHNQKIRPTVSKTALLIHKPRALSQNWLNANIVLKNQ